MNTLSLRRNPLSLAWSRTLRTAVWYLLGYQVVGWVLFAITLSAVLTGVSLGITLAGLPLLIAAAAVIRWCANVERLRLRTVYGQPVAGRYREITGSGIMARLRTGWRDPAIWRDIAYLLGMFVPLVTLDLAVLVIWLVFLAGITLPAWYWVPWQTVHGQTFHGYQIGYFPNGPHGHPGYGLYVDTLPKALLAGGHLPGPVPALQLRRGRDRPAARSRRPRPAPPARRPAEGGERTARPPRPAAHLPT